MSIRAKRGITLWQKRTCKIPRPAAQSLRACAHRRVSARRRATGHPLRLPRKSLSMDVGFSDVHAAWGTGCLTLRSTWYSSLRSVLMSFRASEASSLRLRCGIVDVQNHEQQHFLMHVNSCYLIRHGFLLAWKGRTCGYRGYALLRATTPPVGTEGVATHLRVLKRSLRTKLLDGLNSSRAEDGLHPSTLRKLYDGDSGRISFPRLGRRPMITSRNDTPGGLFRSLQVPCT